jgi:type VI secretion system secreted protein Hcp
MGLNAFLKLKGAKQGEIKGAATQKGREGKIMVIAANHEILSLPGVTSGMATGKQVHKPFVITKEVDKSSVLLYQALVNNKTMIEWELQFWRPSGITTGAGVEKQYYTVKLTDASIVDMMFVMPITNSLIWRNSTNMKRWSSFTNQYNGPGPTGM